MDSYRIPYSIPIFLMSRCGEYCFEYGFRNPAYEYWYAHPVTSQNLFELYGSDNRRKTTLLRPELFSTTPSYIKYNLYLSSTKIRENPFFLRFGAIRSFLFQYYFPQIPAWDLQLLCLQVFFRYQSQSPLIFLFNTLHNPSQINCQYLNNFLNSFFLNKKARFD